MNNLVYEGNFAGHPIKFRFEYPGTQGMFRGFLRRADTKDFDVKINSNLTELARSALPPDSSDAYVEYRMLISETAKYLLRHKASIFHSVSFIYKGKAWLLAAPSGVGKTTQYRNWQRLFPEEIRMISGDMPVISVETGGQLHVWPTSWNGKENIGNRIDAPLGGIIYLEQGQENRMEDFPPHKAVMPLLRQFMVLPDTENEIFALTGLIDTILKTIPVKKYINLGNDASTVLLRSVILDLSNNDINPANMKESAGNAADADPVVAMTVDATESSHTRETYQSIPGIIQTSIAGECFLIAEKEARKHCPYITEINETSAFLWQQLKKETTMEGLLKAVRDVYEIDDPEDARDAVESFLAEMKRLGYLKEKNIRGAGAPQTTLFENETEETEK